MSKHASSLRLLPVCLLGLLAVSACRKAPVETYRIPHEGPRTAAAADMSSQPVPGAEGAPDIRWRLPAGWEVQPDQTGMRKGSFVVRDQGGHEATIAVTVFPGDVGGDLANINRWLGQIQQPPITQDDLPRIVSVLDLPAGPFKRVDLLGAGPEPADPAHDHRMRTIGAWHAQDGRTWFFKMTGDATLVSAQSAAFDAFIASVVFTAEPLPGAPAAVAAALQSAPATPSGPAAAGDLTWTAPASWQAKDLGPMRKASYTVGDEADFSVIAFPGEAGGDLANINRWRGQVQLPPLTEAQLAAETESVAGQGLTFTLVDFAGGGTRITGAILPHAGQSYFFKLTGPDAVVAAARPEFIAFLQSVTAR
ncbi:MAG: hypothetical protein ABII82_04110 [Verrucomicrobiota bacterium]